MKLTIPGRLPGLNEITDAARGNRYASAKMKKEYTELVAWCAKAARLPRMEKIDLAITWYEPNKRRDKDNIMAGQKFIWDGLVQAGVIENDGWKQIGDILHFFAVDKANPRVEVEITDISELREG
jgi:Holliday junction resolvase RusA-like endonuclease